MLNPVFASAIWQAKPLAEFKLSIAQCEAIAADEGDGSRIWLLRILEGDTAILRAIYRHCLPEFDFDAAAETTGLAALAAGPLRACWQRWTSDEMTPEALIKEAFEAAALRERWQ